MNPMGILGQQSEEQAPVNANAMELAASGAQLPQGGAPPQGMPPQGGEGAPPTLSPLETFLAGIIKHEGLEPFQTPFRITSDKMRKWVSMFDSTLKVQLDPKAQKGKGRQNFLYLKNQEDLGPAIVEQFRRYYERDPEITIDKAVRRFDQTGANGKLAFLASQGIDPNMPLSVLFEGAE